MHPFEFATARDEESALDLLAKNGSAKFLAGGTTLIDLMKLNVERPTHLVDINRLPLNKIEELPDGGVRIGAMARNSDLAHHEMIRTRFPALSQAVLAGASPQIRNMATTGGNLLQRTRCFYFRDSALACNKREPGSGCSAIHGYNRIHAVLGGSEQCIATHPSDMAVALVALDAIVRVKGANGERTIPLLHFHLLPHEHPERETALEPGELITAVDVPALSFGKRSLYLKVRDRASYAFALASAAVALDVEGGKIKQSRIALGGVGTKPWRATTAEETLTGKPLTADSFQRAANAALDGAVPRPHNAFKVDLAKRTLMRALAKAGALP